MFAFAAKKDDKPALFGKKTANEPNKLEKAPVRQMAGTMVAPPSTKIVAEPTKPDAPVKMTNEFKPVARPQTASTKKPEPVKEEKKASPVKMMSDFKPARPATAK